MLLFVTIVYTIQFICNIRISENVYTAPLTLLFGELTLEEAAALMQDRLHDDGDGMRLLCWSSPFSEANFINI